MSDETEETIHAETVTRNRSEVATYLERVAKALRQGDPIPADSAQTVTVEAPGEFEMELELEREDGMINFEIEMEWPESDGGVETNVSPSKATFQRYTDNAGKWRWRLRHNNGSIIADSGQGYASKQKVTQGLKSVKRNAPEAAIEDSE